MPHMQHAGTIFYVGVCVRTATTNQMVSSTRPEAEVLGTRVIFFKYSYSYNLCQVLVFILNVRRIYEYICVLFNIYCENFVFLVNKMKLS